MPVVAEVPMVYGVRPPDAYYRAAAAFSWLSFSIFYVYPSECTGGARTQLQLLGGGPLGLIGLVLACGIVAVWVQDCYSDRRFTGVSFRRGFEAYWAATRRCAVGVHNKRPARRA